VIVIAAAVGMTAFGAAVALAIALRPRESVQKSIPVPAIASAPPAPSAPALEEIDVSDLVPGGGTRRPPRPK
jgi:hypothetical protein